MKSESPNRKEALTAGFQKIQDAISKAPSWAAPIMKKHLARYLRAARKVTAMPPEDLPAAMLQFPATAATIVREMTEEIKREAERHGHSLTVAAMNEAKRQAGQAPGGSKKKPLN